MDLKEQLIQKAAKIIQGQCNEAGYCALTLMDIDDRPNTTTITPSKANGIQCITFCTGYGTRTERIQFRPDACVCFNSPEYHISLKGKMEIMNDPVAKKEMWYQGFEQILVNHYWNVREINIMDVGIEPDIYVNSDKLEDYLSLIQ